MHHLNEKLVSFTPAYESPKIARAYLTSFEEQQEKMIKICHNHFGRRYQMVTISVRTLSLFDGIKSLIRSLKAREHFSTNALFI